MAKKQPKIGLALGGGAARGFAHIPIIKKLEERNIPIDIVSGTSAGSIIGAYYCLNLELDSFIEKIESLKKSDYLKLLDLTNPNHSLIKGEKIKKYLKDNFFKDYTFDDLKIPLIICASCLETKKPVYFKKGKLIDAIMASISIPGIVGPYKIGDQNFIDGGIIDPVPSDILLKHNAKKVIAVNLNDFPDSYTHPSNIFNLLATSFYMMMAGLAQKDDKKVFVLKPQFDTVPGEAFKFYNWKNFYGSGESIIKRHIKEIEKWLKK